MVDDPDEVGRGNRAPVTRAGRGDGGFGRHTAGSNLFHHLRVPWGSSFECGFDMDHIDDHGPSIPADDGMEHPLAGYRPEVPDDFAHDNELDPVAYGDEVHRQEWEDRARVIGAIPVDAGAGL